MEVDYTKVSISIYSKLADIITIEDKHLANELANIRTLLATITDKKISITFRAIDSDLLYIVSTYNIFNKRKLI